MFFNFVNINFDEIILKAIALKYISIYIFSRRTFSKEKIIKKIWKLQFRDSITSVISPPNQTTLIQYFEPVSPLSWTIDRTTTQTEQPLYELLYNPTNLMQQLLESEGIKVVDNQIVDFDKHFWEPISK